MAVSKREVIDPQAAFAAAPVGAAAQPSGAPTRTAASDAPNPGMIGARLRARRLEHGVSLRQFARDLDVSASFISQLETGKAQPSVATLFSICNALGISSDELFDGTPGEDRSDGRGDGTSSRSPTDAGSNAWLNDATFGVRPDDAPGRVASGDAVSASPVVRPENRKVLVLDSGVTWESLTAFRSERTDFLFVRYDVGGSSTMEGRLIRHVGTEYGFVLSGVLEVTLGFENYRLTAGHSISFDSTRPHRLTNVGDVPVEAIWFNFERLDSSH